MVFKRKTDINSNSGATAGCRGCGCLSCFGSKSSTKYESSPLPEDKYEKEKETNIRQQTQYSEQNITQQQRVIELEDREAVEEELLSEEDVRQQLLDNSQRQHKQQQQVCQRRVSQHRILVEGEDDLCLKSHNEMKVRVNIFFIFCSE